MRFFPVRSVSVFFVFLLLFGWQQGAHAQSPEIADKLAQEVVETGAAIAALRTELLRLRGIRKANRYADIGEPLARAREDAATLSARVCPLVAATAGSPLETVVRWQKIRVDGLGEDLESLQDDPQVKIHMHGNPVHADCSIPPHPISADVYIRQLQEAISRQYGALQTAYRSTVLPQDPDAEGAIFVWLEIDAEGHLGTVDVVYSELPFPEFLQQLTDALAGLAYPPPDAGGWAGTYQLNFYR